MKTSDFYFDLPEELIAQEPLADRASSRLMVVHKDSGRREHRHFRDIKEYLRRGLSGYQQYQGSACQIIRRKSRHRRGDGDSFAGAKGYGYMGGSGAPGEKGTPR